MVKKQSEILSEELERLRTEIKVITDSEEPAAEDDLARAETLGEEWDIKKAAYDKAVAHEAKVDEIMRAQLSPSNRENSNDRRGPEVVRKVDPYENYESLSRSLRAGRENTGSFDAKDTISRAKYALEQIPKYLAKPEQKERAMELLEQNTKHSPLIARHILLTGSEEYHRQFEEYVASQGTYAGDLLRTAMSLTAANGGYLVPMTLDPSIILTNSGVAGSIRSISTNKTIATDDWNGVTSAGVTASWTAEGVETADATPTFAQPTITPKRADAWVFGSYEVIADSGFASELQRLLADAKFRLEEAAFATANTGATRPRGVLAAVAAVTASIVTSATTNAFVVGDVYNTSDALRPRDAAQTSWIANKKIFSQIRRFDTSGGGSFWTNLGPGVPQQLLGQPNYECSTMTGVVSTGANILLIGNFSQYYVIDRIGMSVIYDPLIRSTGNNRPTGQAGWFAMWRVGADVVDADAFRLLQLNQVAAATALG